MTRLEAKSIGALFFSVSSRLNLLDLKVRIRLVAATWLLRVNVCCRCNSHSTDHPLQLFQWLVKCRSLRILDNGAKNLKSSLGQVISL